MSIIGGHTCIGDDGGTPGRKCDACEAERIHRKQTEVTEQPMPIGNDQPICHVQAIARARLEWGTHPLIEIFIEDLNYRLSIGIQRYRQPLQPFNGRDFLKDQYDEILDAIAYGEGILMEDKVQPVHKLLVYEFQRKMLTYAVELRAMMYGRDGR